MGKKLWGPPDIPGTREKPGTQRQPGSGKSPGTQRLGLPGTVRDKAEAQSQSELVRGRGKSSNRRPP